MAEPILNGSSSVTCPHHGTATPQHVRSILVVDGSAALVNGDFTMVSVAGCTNVTNSNTGAVQCTTMGSATAGVSTTLLVEGRAVLLDTLRGPMTGNDPTLAPPTPQYSATAHQSLLEAE